MSTAEPAPPQRDYSGAQRGRRRKGAEIVKIPADWTARQVVEVTTYYDSACPHEGCGKRFTAKIVSSRNGSKTRHFTYVCQHCGNPIGGSAPLGFDRATTVWKGEVYDRVPHE